MTVSRGRFACKWGWLISELASWRSVEIVHSWKPLVVWIPLWPRVAFDGTVKNRWAFGIVSTEDAVNRDRGFFCQEARVWKSWGYTSRRFTYAFMYMNDRSA